MVRNKRLARLEWSVDWDFLKIDCYVSSFNVLAELVAGKDDCQALLLSLCIPLLHLCESWRQRPQVHHFELQALSRWYRTVLLLLQTCMSWYFSTRSLVTKFLLSFKALLCCMAVPNKAVILSGQLMKQLRDFKQMWEELRDIFHKSEISISSLHVSLGIRLLFGWDLPWELHLRGLAPCTSLLLFEGGASFC